MGSAIGARRGKRNRDGTGLSIVIVDVSDGVCRRRLFRLGGVAPEEFAPDWSAGVDRAVARTEASSSGVDWTGQGWAVESDWDTVNGRQGCRVPLSIGSFKNRTDLRISRIISTAGGAAFYLLSVLHG